jgi:3-hexulose-6-phosphate synthase/6-phospho-3-hexuloisomerase
MPADAQMPVSQSAGRSRPLVQISLDVTSIPAALELAGAAARAGVDWMEAGTPLILAEGLHGIRALRKAFPDKPLVADLKTMDGAGLEAEMMFQAGANMVVVMGQAHDASIIEQVKMARRYNGQVMCDVMLCPDKPARARRAQELGVDYIIVHTGFDERNMIPGLSPLDDLPPILDAVSIPVQAVGGLSVEQAIETWELGAQIVVFGAPLVIRSDRFEAAGDDFEAQLRAIMDELTRRAK